MTELTSPRVLWVKAGLFVLCGAIAGLLILLEHPSLRVGVLLMLSVWCFCRAYYFAFHVVERYIDATYRFAGLWSLVRFVKSKSAAQTSHVRSRPVSE